MSARGKVRLLLVSWIGFGVLVLWPLDPAAAAPVIFVGFIVFGVGSFLIRCAHCGNPVSHNPVQILATEIWIWTPWTPALCSKCGKEL